MIRTDGRPTIVTRIPSRTARPVAGPALDRTLPRAPSRAHYTFDLCSPVGRHVCRSDNGDIARLTLLAWGADPAAVDAALAAPLHGVQRVPLRDGLYSVVERYR